MELKNTITLITGGNSGMGLATAEYFAKAGAVVTILDKQIEDRSAFYGIQCDVSDSQQVEKAFEEIASKKGVPQIIINCAGIAPAKKIIGKEGLISLEFFEKVMAVNVNGTFNVMKTAAALMAEAKHEDAGKDRGVIINTASVAAFEGQIGQVAYSASKSAIIGMTLPAARELARYSIRVNVIAPGLVATPLLTGMSAEVQQSLYQTVTYPQRFAEPVEFAKLAAHIVENQYINAETIRLDGGIRMQAR